MRSIATVLPVLLVALVARSAWADLLPPSRGDPRCTVQEQCPGGAECPSGARWDASAIQTCADEQTAKGREIRCHRDGIYLGTNVYCPSSKDGSSAAPPSAPSGSASTSASATASTAAPPSPPRGHGFCAVSPESRSTVFEAMLGGVLALLVARRRVAAGDRVTP
jgi:hypothetical protein